MVKIIAVHACAVEALATASVEYLDHAMLHTSYKSAINLACALHSSVNLTDQFAILVIETKDLMLKCDATITDHNALPARVVQLKAQLMQTID
jgi:hypothetical protein